MIEWIACEARTGRQIAFLPDLAPTGPLKRTLGRSDSLSFTLPLGSAPANWERATRRGSTVLVAVDGDDPVYGCLIMRSKRSWSADPSASLVQIDAVTVEGYFDRRYVGNATYSQVGQNAIVADLIGRFAQDGATPGLPIRVETRGLPGMLRDRTYLDTADKTVLSVLTDLADVIGGPEWTVEWEYTAGPRPTYTPVLYVGDRIGQDPPAGLQPPTFTLPGSIVTAELVESYEAGKGANRVTATGQKTGDDRAQVTLDDSTDTDLPTFELRGSVSTTNSDLTSLEDHARGDIAVSAPGQSALTLTAVAVDSPRLAVSGQDGAWRLGDTLAVDITTPDGGGPGSFAGWFRCIGWERDTLADPETITPILLVQLPTDEKTRRVAKVTL